MFVAMLLYGCTWIGLDAYQERLDVDDDGVDAFTDCDDEDAGVGGPGLFFTDADGDGAGDPTTRREACVPAADEVSDDGDCDDTDATVGPDASEVCSGRDDDCNGLADDDDPGVDATTASLWLPDDDGDGFPVADLARAVTACVQPDGYAPSGSPADCDDDPSDPDGDGVAVGFGINPAAQELCGDLVDNDCNGQIDEFGFNDAEWYADADGDGWPDDFTLVERCNDGDGAFVLADGFDPATDPVDCAPDDPARSPGTAEVWYDGIDQDCGGDDDYDRDGDGFVPDAFSGLSPLPGGDCDDSDAAVSPAGIEVYYDGVDADCSGTDDWDADGDGFTLVGAPSGNATDCDDSDPDVSPAATDTPYDGIDTDCDGGNDYDADGDGFSQAGSVGPDPTDCDDADATVFPGASEIWYDGRDQDCAGDFDFDQDGDTWVPSVFSGQQLPVGFALGDCDDADASVSPDGVEACNGIDDDCSGQIDEAPAIDPAAFSALVDGDFDGFPSGTTIEVCALGPGLINPGGGIQQDCDDGAAAIFPGALDVPDDGIDQNCSGDDAITCFVDGDEDGVGGSATLTVDAPDCGVNAAVAGDCDDADPDVYPGAPEWCDAIDQDCDTVLPVGIGTVTRNDGSRAPVSAGPLDLDGVVDVALCGGTWDLELLPQSYETVRLRGVDGFDTVLAPSGALLDVSGAEGWSLSVEHLEWVPAGGVAIQVSGVTGAEPELRLTDIVVAGANVQVLIDVLAVDLRLEQVSLDTVTASGPAPLVLRPGATLVADGLSVQQSSGTVAGALAVTDSDRVDLLGSEFVSGTGSQGGAISASNSRIFAVETTFAGNAAASGGAIFQGSGSVELRSCTVESNSADSGGAVHVNDGSFSAVGGRVDGNTATVAGGAVRLEGGVFIATSTQLNENTAPMGGAVDVSGLGFVSISDSLLDLNQADDGGALRCSGGMTCLVTRSEIGGNEAVSGGGISLRDEAALNLSRVSLAFNSAASDGGAVYSASSETLRILDSTVTGNGAAQGGGLYVDGPLESIDTVFDSNTATGGGGAIFEDAEDGTRIDIIAGEMTLNSAQTGGAVWTTLANIDDVPFVGNTAVHGGAVFVPERCFADDAGYVHIEDGVFDGNTATGAGGAISVQSMYPLLSACFPSPGPSRVDVFTDFVGNEAAYGGAIANSGTLGLGTESFTANSATVSGGAVFGSVQQPITNGVISCTVEGTLFDGNTAPLGGALHLRGSGITDFQCGATFDNQSADDGSVAWVESGLLDDTDLVMLTNPSSTGADVRIDAGGQVDVGLGGFVGPVVFESPNVGESCVYTSDVSVACDGATGCTPCP